MGQDLTVSAGDVLLEDWGEGDRWLLEQTLRDPTQMIHLGGPEDAGKIARRHRSYLAGNAARNGRMMRIVRRSDGVSVGTIGFWDREDSAGDGAYETGWHVLPEFQGRGYATEATRLTVELARADGKWPSIHAYPNVENAASNRICEKAGFTLLGPVPIEYPAGHWMTCNDWCLDLRQSPASAP